MAMDVNYYLATGEVYNAATKDTKAFYLVDNGDGTSDLYLGTLKLSNAADLATAVSNIAKNAGDITAINATLTKLENTEETTGSIRSIIKGYFDALTAADVPIADADENFTATDVEGALAELADMVEDAQSAGEITLGVAETTTTGYLKTYELKQNNALIGKIDIPKDFVLKSGKLVTVTSGTDSDGDTATVADGKYIKLVVNVSEGSAANSVIYINVADLIDAYTGSGDAVDAPTTGVTISVDSNNVISATIVTLDGSKIDAGTVTKAKLATSVQNSLDLADSAIQQEDMTADNVAYTSTQTVAFAIAALEEAVGEGGSVADQIDNAIADLDSSVSAGAGKAITGVTETDGKLVSVTTVDLTANNIEYAAAVPESSEGAGDGQAAVSVKDELDQLIDDIDAVEAKIGNVPQTAGGQDQTVIEYVDSKVGDGVSSLTGNATVATKTSADIVTIKGAIKQEDGVISNDATATDITLAKAAVTGAAVDVSVADAGSYFTTKNVEAALQQIAQHLTWQTLTAN